MKYTPRLPKTNVNIPSTSPLREFFILAAGLLAATAAVYLLLGVAVDWVVPHISHDLEKKWGAMLLRWLPSQDFNPRPQLCLEELVNSLEDNCAPLPYRFKLYVSEMEDVNAWALPGGNMVVSSGLLKRVSSENELVFVLAHELGHYAHRDHLRGLGRGVVLMTISSLLFGPDRGVTKWLIQGVRLTELHFSRKQEMQADEFALNLLLCRYGHVGGATDFFERLPAEKDPGTYGQYFATHPQTKRRIARLRSIISARGLRKLQKRPLPEKIAVCPKGISHP